MKGAHRRSPRPWVSLLSLLCLLLLGTAVVRAQPTPTPISLGENQLGSIAVANGKVQYSLSVAAPQSVDIQVLAVTPGVVPTFTVLDPSGGVVLEVANPGTQSIAQGTANLLSPGVYRIDVANATGAAGQVLLSVQEGEPLLQPLTIGQNEIGTIPDAGSRVQYGLTVTTPQSVNLQVLAITPGFAPAFRVLGTDDGVLMDQANPTAQSIARGIVDLPAAFTYIVEVRSANNTPGQYLISPQPTAPLPTATPFSTAVPASTLTPEPDAACRLTPSGSQTVNVRFGPGTGYSIVGSLAQGASAPVMGRLADTSWFQIDRGGSVGWVAATVVTLTGECSSVSVVVPPPPPPTQPAATTSAPSITPTPIASPQAPTVTPTASPEEDAPTATTPPVATTAPLPLHLFEEAETRPDLIITGTDFRVGARNQGPVYFTFNIANQGRSNSGPFTLRLCVNTTCFDQVYSGIWADGGTGGSFNIGERLAGTSASYIFAIDFANDVDEADETNNLVSGTVYFD